MSVSTSRSMDSLLDYGSSSGSDDSPPPKISRNYSIDNHKPLSPRLSHDFFNITNTNLSPVKQDDIQKVKPKTICVNNTYVPNTDFWKNMSEKDYKSTSEIAITSGTTSRWEQTIAQTKYSNALIRNVSPSWAPNPTGTKMYDKVGIKTNTHTLNRVGHHSQPVLPSQTNSDRKIYYIHHKIEPHLCSRKRNHPPRSIYRRMTGHTGVVNRVDWCPFKNHSHLLLSASMDKTLGIWNPFSDGGDFLLRRLAGHTEAVRDAVWDNTGCQVLSASYDKKVLLTDVERGISTVEFSHPTYVSCVKYHPVHHSIFITGGDDIILTWDVRTPGKPIKTSAHTDVFGQVQDVCFINDGREFVTCNNLVCKDSSDRNIMAWDFDKAVCVSNQIYQERYTCTRLKLHPRGDYFVAQSQGNYIARFSTRRPYKMNRQIRYGKHQVAGYSLGCDFSPDGSLLASGSSNGRLYIYNSHTGDCIQHVDTGHDVCLDVACHPVLPGTVAVSCWNGDIAVCQ